MSTINHLNESNLARVLELAELAADMTRAEREHTALVEKGNATLYASTVTVAHDLGVETFLNDYWPAAKKLITSSPEMAAKYECSPNQKSPGKYNVPRYLTQVVSRIKAAFDNGIKFRKPNGEPVPVSKLTQQIAAANKAKLEKTRHENDGDYDLRQEAANAVAFLSDAIRKGSHDAQVLISVKAEAATMAKRLGVEIPKPEPKKPETAKGSARKPTNKKNKATTPPAVTGAPANRVAA